MDIVVKGILSYIQSLEGHKSSVLAGGAVRDEIFGLVPNDYDFFIPSKHPRDIEYLIQSIGREFTIESAVCKSKDYGFLKKKRVSSNGQGVLSVWGFIFEGKKIDLIGLQENDDEDFPFEVIRSFDYGVNMVYDNGSYVDTEASDFRSDRDNYQMSLINLQDISGLPKAIQRFERFNERQKKVTGTDFTFRAPCLEFKSKKEKKYEYSEYGMIAEASWDSPRATRTTQPPSDWTRAIIENQQAVNAFQAHRSQLEDQFNQRTTMPTPEPTEVNTIGFASGGGVRADTVHRNNPQTIVAFGHQSNMVFTDTIPDGIQIDEDDNF